MKTKSFAALVALLLTSACVSVDPITPGPQGYDTIEFTRATVVRDRALNQYLFPAGRRFIADRRGKDGRSLYCGLLTINGDQRPFDTCIGFEAPDTLILGPGVPLKEVRRPQPAGTIKLLKAKL